MAMVLESPQLGGYNKHFTMHDPDNNTSPSQLNEADRRMSASDHRPISALARGVQITEFEDSRINPMPLLTDESDLLIEQYLSPGKLQMLTGVDNLQMVQNLELKVDARETSLGNFGSMLPNLTELKLSGSCIQCVRDLGSSLHHLRVLWLTRCGLEELDGISSMLALTELYLEYNEISDLSPLSMLEELQILDLEGNNIEDISQVQYLSLCPKLRKLALDGNPICVCPHPDHSQPEFDYRSAIHKYLPNLNVLDDESMGDGDGPGVNTCHNVFDEDWAFLEELQGDALLKDHFNEETVDQGAMGGSGSGDRPLSAALRPATGYRPGSTLRPSSGFRPLTSKRPSSMSGGQSNAGSRPSTSANRPVSSDAVEGLEVASELTMGNVICGNPSKALRQRKSSGPGSKAEVQKGLSRLLQKGAVFRHSEDTEEEPFKPEEEMNSIIEELQSWKVEHEKRIKEILKSKEAQVLVVDHDEAEDVFNLSDSITDESDADTPRESLISPQPHRHKADLLLRSKTNTNIKSTSSDDSTAAVASRLDHSITAADKPAPPKIISKSKYAMLRGSVISFDNDNESRDDSTSVASDDSFERASSVASSSYQRPISRGGGGGATSGSNYTKEEQHLADFDLSPRPKSRGHGGSEPLAPLRVPSPTPSQLRNQAQARPSHSRPIQSPPSPKAPRKLRVGPTGLPLSSSQQPVIRNSLGSASSRSQPLVPGTSSNPRGNNIALLPSQPRIPRHLPEPPSLLPHPPKH